MTAAAAIIVATMTIAPPGPGVSTETGRLREDAWPAASGPAAPDTAPGALAFRGVRVFDGDTVLAEATVVVRGDTVAAVGPDVRVPPGARAVHGEGRTLLPGLVDAHAHTFARRQLERAAVFGVTAQLDMATDPAFLREMRREREEGDAADRAHVFGAGYPATAPGGHGTQFGMDVPPLRGPGEAREWVERRAGEGADWIKVIRETGAASDTSLPGLGAETVRRLVTAAHDRGLPVVVHVSTLEAALGAAEAGADGLAHVWRDRPAPDSAVRRLREAGLFVIPTLAVIESVTLGRGGPSLAGDPALRPHLLPYTREHLERTAADGEPDPRAREAREAASASTLRLWRAGVPILAGTDAPNPGVAYGASLHRELELLVRAGLPERAALEAATSAPAEALGLEGRGRIAPGSRADLVLVEGDPTADVTRTRHIAGVWTGGRRVRWTPDPARGAQSLDPGGADAPAPDSAPDSAAVGAAPVAVDGGLPGEAGRRLALALEEDSVTVRRGESTVPRGDTVPSSVLVVGGRTRVRGRVSGHLLGVDADFRLGSGASVGGDVVALGGRLYRSPGADVEGRVAYDPAAEVRAERRGGGWLLRGGAESGGPRLELDGPGGLHAPRLQRVDGWTPGAGGRVRWPSLPGSPDAGLDLGYRAGRERAAGTLRLELRPAEGWRLGAEAGRGTRSGERWIRSDAGNSLGYLLGGEDLRNYHASDRVRLSVSRAAGGARRDRSVPEEAASGWRAGDGLRLRARAGWERVRSLEAIGAARLFGDGPVRPNPPVDEVEAWTAGLSARLRRGDWRRGWEARVGLEGASARVAGDVSYLWLRARGRMRLPDVGPGRLRVQGRARADLAGDLPRHRWSALGGPGTLRAVEPLALRGPRTAWARATWRIPLPDVGRVLGRRPEALLSGSAGAAWGAPADGRPLRSTLSAGVRVSVVEVGLAGEPAPLAGAGAARAYLEVSVPRR